jgi:hypothetical protein
MMAALERTAEYLGVKDSLLILGSVAQPVQLHCVPDSFSIPESKKFAAYIFDDEVSSSNSDEPGKLHILASFGGVTELQIRRHLGNFEAAEVYSAPLGILCYGSGLRNAVCLPAPLHQLTRHAIEVIFGCLLADRARAADHQSCEASKPDSRTQRASSRFPRGGEAKVQKMSASRKNSPSLLHWMTRLLILFVVEIGQDAFGEFS